MAQIKTDLDCPESSLDSGGDDLVRLKTENALDEDMKETPVNTITYRIVQVSDGLNSQESQAILTTDAGGQYFLIGNPSDVFGTTINSKVILPKEPAKKAISKPIMAKAPKPTVNKPGAQIDLSFKRRATHNEVERRRRDKINTWICKLGALVPDVSSTQSKSSILAKACEYISELNNKNEEDQKDMTHNERYELELSKLRQELAKLRKENSQLRQQLDDRNTGGDSES